MPIHVGEDEVTSIIHNGAEVGRVLVHGDLHWERPSAGPTVVLTTVFSADQTTATLTATATGVGTLSYNWYDTADPTTMLNDNSTDIDIVVSDDGTYECEVTDDNGTTIECIVVTGINEPISIALNNVPGSRNVGTTISGVTVTVADADHPTGLTWSVAFNGGTIHSGTTTVTNDPVPNQTARATPGTDTYTATATDPDGSTDSATHNINVVIPAPVVSWTAGSYSLSVSIAAWNALPAGLTSASAMQFGTVDVPYTVSNYVSPFSYGIRTNGSVSFSGSTNPENLFAGSTNPAAQGFSVMITGASGTASVPIVYARGRDDGGFVDPDDIGKTASTLTLRRITGSGSGTTNTTIANLTGATLVA